MLQVTVAVDAGPRADLTVCGREPFAVLLGEVAAMLGVTDSVRASVAGRPIHPERGLAEQGVLDGAVICLSPQNEPFSVPVINADPAQALAEQVAAHAEDGVSPQRLIGGWALAVVVTVAGSWWLATVPGWARIWAAESMVVGIPVGLVMLLSLPGLTVALVGADPAAARRIWVPAVWVIGVGMALVAVPAVAAGWAGAAVAAVAAGVIALRGRHYADPVVRWSWLASAAVLLTAVVAAGLISHPAWRWPLIGACAGAGLLAQARLPVLVGRRLAEIAETACLVAMPPLVAVATGLSEAVRR